MAYFQGVELTETEEPEFKAKVSGCLKNPDSKFFSFDAVARLILKLLLFFFKSWHLEKQGPKKIKCSFLCLISDYNVVLNNKWMKLNGYGKVNINCF